MKGPTHILGRSKTRAGALQRLGRAAVRLGRRVRRLSTDTEGQAMTEFVIVVPVVLLAFFAAMQTVVIGEAVQYCNYAAFAAARSYATSYAKFQRENDPDPHRSASVRARCVAAMALAPVSHGMNYMLMFPGDTTRFSTGELTSGMIATRVGSNTQDALKQQLLEGFTVAFVYRIEGFRIIRPASDRDPRATVDCRFTYRLPLAVPGLASIWSYLRQKEVQGGDTSERLDEVSLFGPNRPFVDDAPIEGPREFSPDSMLPEFTDVLERWHTPDGPDVATNVLTAYGQYFISGGRGEVPATARIGAKARVGFEPLIGDMP